MARILFASTLEAFPWGGSEELWAETARKMLAGGHQIAACVTPAQSAHPKLQGLSQMGCRIFPRLFRSRFYDRIWNRLAPQSKKRSSESPFTKALREFLPDLVVISQGGNLCINPYADECGSLGVPYCTVVQSVPEAVFVPDDSSYPTLARAYLGARRVFFVSDGNRQVLERQIAAAIPMAARVFNPVNLQSTELEPWPEDLDHLAFACVARVEFYAKGQDLILDVLDSVKWRERPVKVSFFGAGPNQELLRELIRSRNLTSASYEGVSSNIRDIWRRHHALILPSRQEGLPLSLVEAALCGRPAIVTRIAGNPEVTLDGETGFVAAAPVAAELELAMENAWQARTELPQMGMNARDRILKEFPADPIGHFVSELEAILKES